MVIAPTGVETRSEARTTSGMNERRWVAIPRLDDATTLEEHD
jgi:hypothetical protein